MAALIFGLASCAPQWVHAQSAGAQVATADVELGRKLFQGSTRFANGGPSCIACHHVQNNAVAPGGTLAADLTAAVSRSGAEGVRAMLPLEKAESPFAVMEAAYRGKRLTEREADALGAFLQDADRHQVSQAPAGFGYKLFFGAAGGLAAMLLLLSLIGQRRKKRSVNQHIYDRQLKTE